MSDSDVREKLGKCVGILEQWDCSSAQIKRLLGIRYPKTLEGVLDGHYPLSPAMSQRADLICNIDQILQETFNTLPLLRFSFVNRKNNDRVFKNMTPLQFMCKGIKSLQLTSDRLTELNIQRKEEGG